MNNNNLDCNDKIVKKVKRNDGTEYEEDIYFKTKRTYRFKEGYMMMFQGEYMDKALSLTDLKDVFGNRTFLMFYLLNHMKTDNRVSLDRKTICQKLGFDKSALSKHLKALSDIGMIKIENHQIVFNTDFVYKGQVKNHNKSY